MSNEWTVAPDDLTHASTLKYPCTKYKQNCLGTKDQDRNWGKRGRGGTLFEEWGYVSIEQLLSVF